MARKKAPNEFWPEFYPGLLTVDEIPGCFVKTVEDDETFHINSGNEPEAVSLLECSVCHGRDFNVGVGSSFTVIRCKSCEWEICIHSG